MQFAFGIITPLTMLTMLLDDAIADDDNLAMLDAFLAGRGDDGGLMLCDLDGFLTAIAIGRDMASVHDRRSEAKADLHVKFLE